MIDNLSFTHCVTITKQERKNTIFSRRKGHSHCNTERCPFLGTRHQKAGRGCWSCRTRTDLSSRGSVLYDIGTQRARKCQQPRGSCPPNPGLWGDTPTLKGSGESCSGCSEHWLCKAAQWATRRERSQCRWLRALWRHLPHPDLMWKRPKPGSTIWVWLCC